MAKSVPEMLRESAETYEQRNLLYGDNYKKFGWVMAALFPEGMIIRSVDDWNRIGTFIQVMSKVTRYSQNFGAGGHDDSVLDISVYTAMLRELDQEVRDVGSSEVPF